ncbi:hypothetical protein BDK51DRAFT_41218 [Blyttiomyces helicus]|uniref:Uncharacterized protein n=1 Tax=Blyttiomyces helicus TaxID=388810 RepID=A0A4V1ISU7_9FUNG|nr:hypothetical protein BDK51DRAFT_41218 [Blyttiomyces helicus]|eukprot:RKO94797.1 hypothetical protein BDK51DRAFT_41218 [Blyttiomyces helicus]
MVPSTQGTGGGPSIWAEITTWAVAFPCYPCGRTAELASCAQSTVNSFSTPPLLLQPSQSPAMVKQKHLSRFQFNEHRLSSLNQLFPNNTYPPKILLHHQLPDNIREDRAHRALQPHGLWPAWPPPQDDLGTPRWRTSDSYKVGTKRQRFLQCQSGTDPAAATRPPKRKAKGRSTHAFSSSHAHVHIYHLGGRPGRGGAGGSRGLWANPRDPRGA